MFSLTIKELAARKVRLLTTMLAVLIGVAFMSGTMVFTDTVGATFDSALADADAGVDAYVRVPTEIPLGYGEPGPRLDASLVDTIAAVDGVNQVAVRTYGYAQVVGPDGQPVGDVSQSPAFGLNWVTVDDLNPYTLVEGHAPANDGEIVIDKASADEAGLEPGDVVTVLTKHEPQQFTLAGVAKFGTSDSPAGATAVMFTDAAAAEMLTEPGQVNAIAITADDGVDESDLVAAVRAALPASAGVEVITGAQLIDQNQELLAKNFDGFGTMMLIFALVAVFVGAFIINNTFSITIAQRTREMAMLRAIGASGRQVKRSVLVEAGVIGIIGSGLGLVAGVAVASGLQAMMAQFGVEMPEYPMQIEPAKLVISAAVGILVTVLSAWLPARRAAKIAPIAAVRDVNVDRAGGSVRRAVVGALVTAGGVGLVIGGLAAGALVVVGAGALATFGGVAVIAPVIAPMLARVLGLPLRLRGVSGELATRNAIRNPKRTARTAASLMIGVGLVGFITVFGASVKTSVAGSLAEDFTGTHIIQTGASDNTAGLSPELAERLRSTAGVDAVAQARMSPAVVDGTSTDALFAFDAATIDQLFRVETVSGDLQHLGAAGLAVSADEATDQGWTIGTPVTVTFPSGSTTLHVAAIYRGATDWVGSEFVDLTSFDANGIDDLDFKVYVAGDEAAIDAVAADYATADVLDRDGFLDSVNADIDTVLGIFNALLGLAVLIALLGIANTLALSIFERRREIGLMRAVGMTRRQVRSTVRWESIVIALLGTSLGLAIGTFFGWAIVRAMSDQGIDTLTVPMANLGVIAVVAGFAGAVAAAVPARRAARLDVLQAITAA